MRDITIPPQYAAGQSPDFEFQADLDDTTYTLRLRWNERCRFRSTDEGSWFIGILDETGETSLRVGLRAVVGSPLAPYMAISARRPAGALMFVDTSGTGKEAKFGDIGKRVVLVYLDAADLGLTITVTPSGAIVVAPAPVGGDV